jgi:hypothetical protein
MALRLSASIRASGRRAAGRSGRRGGRPRRFADGVAGRRGRSSAHGAPPRPGETQSSASSRSTLLCAGLARSFGATAMRVAARRERSAARSRRGAGSRRSRSLRLSARWARPVLGAGRRRAGASRDRRFWPRSAAGSGPPHLDREDEVEQPKGEDFGFVSRGVRERRHCRSGGDWIALPCTIFQAGCEDVRVRQTHLMFGPSF